MPGSSDFEKGKHFVDGTLRYLGEKDQFELRVTTSDKQTVTFIGSLKDARLVAERKDDKTKETHRLVISLLHDNRYLYHYEVQREGIRYPASSTPSVLPRKAYLS